MFALSFISNHLHLENTSMSSIEQHHHKGRLYIRLYSNYSTGKGGLFFPEAMFDSFMLVCNHQIFGEEFQDSIVYCVSSVEAGFRFHQLLKGTLENFPLKNAR